MTSPQSDQKPKLDVVLAAPRGFCAGVVRAIDIVERALEKWGAPVYVRHEIVHNKYVVERLERMGAVFVDELDEVPNEAPVIFSAHGVPKSVPAEAERRNMTYVDATCPLVSKVHRESERHFADGRHVLLIGHEGHPEVIGTMGQLPDGAVTLIEGVADAEAFEAQPGQELAFATQTTLSVDDTADIIAVLQQRFPDMSAPKKEDICYATTNRQAAVKAVASAVDAFLVIGAPNSSNSRRLVEVAEKEGCSYNMLIGRAADIDWDALKDVKSVAISAGASAPEELVDEVVDAFRARYDVSIVEDAVAREDVVFKVPKVLANVGADVGAAS